MAAHPPRASPPEEFAEFAKYAQLLPLQEGAGAASTLQEYFDGAKEPTQLCGSILILSGGNAMGARFARVRTHQGYNAAGQTWRVIVKGSDDVINADRQWFHDHVHAAAVGVLHDSAVSRTLPSRHARVRIRGDLARAFPSYEPEDTGLVRTAVQVLQTGDAAEAAVTEMTVEELFDAIVSAPNRRLGRSVALEQPPE